MCVCVCAAAEDNKISKNSRTDSPISRHDSPMSPCLVVLMMRARFVKDDERGKWLKLIKSTPSKKGAVALLQASNPPPSTGAFQVF